MTSRSDHGPSRILAPLRPAGPCNPSVSVARRTKRSTACTACQVRKSKCSGSSPCQKCIATGSNCVFVIGLDRRRKCAQKHAEQELKKAHSLLGNIINAFDAGDTTELTFLLSTAKGRCLGQTTQDAITCNTEQVSGRR
ncbi:hypothetical protein BDV18DRAFT_70508 [Aspergillus unguis]